MMKKTIINILSTTTMALFVLSIIGIFSGANILINSGYILTRKFESPYVILEVTVDIIYTIAVLFIFGAIFHWLPMNILAVMGVLIYLAGLFLDMFRIREDIGHINQLLQKRNKNRT